MRKIFIAGNWKMNMTHLEAVDFIKDLKYKFRNKNNCDVAICVPFTAIESIKKTIKNTNIDIKVGAQNMFYEEAGAFTGEVSPKMLKALGVDCVIVGHSERREIFGEKNEVVNKKVKAAFEIGLKPIMCIGEKLSIRESGNAEEFVIGQLVECINGIDKKNIGNLTIAYEPIWAIGTGKTATSEDANVMCRAIRKKIGDLFGNKIAEEIRIQYGGSVKPNNTAELMAMTDIDGALVGGASLKVDDFLAIINY